MNKHPRNQEGGAANEKNNVITGDDVAGSLIKIKYKADEKREQDTADRSCHSAKAYYRTNSTLGKHIRNDRKNVGAPCLVGCYGKTD